MGLLNYFYFNNTFQSFTNTKIIKGKIIQFQTLKSDLTHSRIADTDSASIHDGEIAVKIESFAFTANNVTYGVAGDTIGYWKFFPAAQ